MKPHNPQNKTKFKTRIANPFNTRPQVVSHGNSSGQYNKYYQLVDQSTN